MLDRLPTVGRIDVAVVGDAMLDLYTWGDVTRISPEAPVPVVNFQRETASPGGAANTAVCVAALGATTVLAAKIGSDVNGTKLTGLLEAQEVSVRALGASGEPTTTKHRIWASGQQLLRLDIETPSSAGADASGLQPVLDVDAHDAVLISDYGKGVVNPESVAWLVAECNRTNTPVVVDPKSGDFTLFRGCTVIKPNEREAHAAYAARYGRTGTLAEVGAYLTTEIATYAIVTLGAHGMMLFGDGEARHFEPRTRTVYDVTGAGDVVASVVTVGLASGWSFDEICEAANMAAGVCVSRVGTGGVTMDDVEEYRREWKVEAAHRATDPANSPS